MKFKMNSMLIVGAVLATMASVAADPLDEWTTGNSGTQDDLNSVAYGQGLFAAVGPEGTIITSAGGLNWTRRSSGTSNRLAGIAFSDGRFVAVGGVGGSDPVSTILTSADGITWKPQETGTTYPLMSVGYGGGRFVAGGGIGAGQAVIVSSTDGVKWTRSNVELIGNPNQDPSWFTSIACNNNNGHFIALYPGNHNSTPGTCVFYSPDGVNWTRSKRSPQDIRSVAYGNGQFVGVGGYFSPTIAYTNVIYSSPDGTNWTQRLHASGNILSSVTYGGGMFMAVGYEFLYRSQDGIKWDGGYNRVSAYLIGYGNGQFFSFGPEGSIRRSGTLGKLGASLSPGGQFQGIISGANGQNYAINSSSNLQDWTPLTNVTISNGVAIFSDAYATNRSRIYQAMVVNK